MKFKDQNSRQATAYEKESPDSPFILHKEEKIDWGSYPLNHKIDSKFFITYLIICTIIGIVIYVST
jgi:hypothetical protein